MFSAITFIAPSINISLSLKESPCNDGLDSFEHDFVEEERAAESNDSQTKVSAEEPSNLERQNVVWNAKVSLCICLIDINCSVQSCC